MKTAIAAVAARQVWDSRGRPTVEAEIRLQNGILGRGIAPSGASRGRFEAIDLRDGDKKFGGFGVNRALANVRGPIDAALKGMDGGDPLAVDHRLEELDGTPQFARLGGNAAVAVSLAAWQAAAASEGLALWRYLARDRAVRLPLPEIQIFGGGAHAGRRIDIQDLMVMVPNAGSVRAALETTAEVYRAAGRLMADAGKLAGTADEGGWWPVFASNEEALEMLMRAIEAAGFKPGEEVFISLDIAASEFFDGEKYRLMLEGRALESAQMEELIENWVRRFPIVSIEDPLAEEATAAMVRLTQRVCSRVQVVGDDYLVSDARKVKEAVRAGALSAALIKINQAGTLTRARCALEAAKESDWATIVSARSGETEDVAITDLAVGWDAGQLKVGAFARGERMAKWNALLRLEEEMGSGACFAGWGAFPKTFRRVQ
jgi:enolase